MRERKILDCLSLGIQFFKNQLSEFLKFSEGMIDLEKAF